MLSIFGTSHYFFVFQKNHIGDSCENNNRFPDFHIYFAFVLFLLNSLP